MIKTYWPRAWQPCAQLAIVSNSNPNPTLSLTLTQILTQQSISRVYRHFERKKNNFYVHQETMLVF